MGLHAQAREQSDPGPSPESDASGEDSSGRDPPEGLVEGSAADDDPLSTGGTESLSATGGLSAPSPASPPAPTQGPPPPEIEAREGAALTAIPGVREVSHAVSVTLAQGMALVAVRLRFVSTARFPAEVRYRLPMAPGGAPAGVEVCVGDRCRQGQPDPSTTYDDAVRARPAQAGPLAPVAELRAAEDVLWVRAAPVTREEPLQITLRYLAPAPLSGGVVRVRIPARGNDMRASAATVRVRAPELLAPTLQGAPIGDESVEVMAWDEVSVGASRRSGGDPLLQGHRFRCGEAMCARVRASAGPRSPQPAHVVLWIDASPSTQGTARGRLPATLAALLATMPAASTVRAVVFAGEAEALVAEPLAPGDVPITLLAQAVGRELGAATRLDRAWDALEVPRGAHVVLLGDGGLTKSPELDATLRAFGEREARLSLINLADRNAAPLLRRALREHGGAEVRVGRTADDAARGDDDHPLHERLASLFMPLAAPSVRVRSDAGWVVLGPLRAGEERVWSGRIGRRLELQAGDARLRPGRLEVRSGQRRLRPMGGTLTPEWWRGYGLRLAGAPLRMSAVDDRDRQQPAPEGCDPRGPAQRASGISTDEAPIALAEARCAPPESDSERTPGRGMPAESVLQMLRQRVVPVARACFRRDRAGRGDYSVRAVFEFTLADTEVASARVEGEITDVLRSCLMSAVHQLEVPPFRGEVVVRYPLRTERVPPPPTIELRDDVATTVDRALGDGSARADDEALLRE